MDTQGCTTSVELVSNYDIVFAPADNLSGFSLINWQFLLSDIIDEYASLGWYDSQDLCAGYGAISRAGINSLDGWCW